MVISKWIILLPLIIGMTMGLLVKNQKLENCISPNADAFTPPPYVFFIVWPILYLIIGFVYYQYLLKHSIKSGFSIFMIVVFILFLFKVTLYMLKMKQKSSIVLKQSSNKHILHSFSLIDTQSYNILKLS